MDAEEVTSPTLEVLEDRLLTNYDEFRRLGEEWTREWQNILTKHRMRKLRERQRAQKSDALREQSIAS